MCYVGITRAMKTLTLTYARVRSTYGGREYQMPSRFLSEIPERFKAGSVPGSSLKRAGWGAALPRRGESEGVTSVGYSAGEKVRHAKFGVGEVVEAQAGKVIVRFGTDERIFVPELAPLSKA